MATGADAEPCLVVEEAGSQRTVPLHGPRMTIGRVGADIELNDPTVSRLHAFLDQAGDGWILEDLGSRNGTYVNGARVIGPRALRDGDEIRFGAWRVVFRCTLDDRHGASLTAPLDAAPRVTPREHDLLVALCRPLLEGSMLEEPSSLREIAAELVVTESGVKKLLSRTFDRFDLRDDDRRRSRLALEALRRGAVTVSDVERASAQPGRVSGEGPPPSAEPSESGAGHRS